MVMEKVHDKDAWKKALPIDPERLALRLSKNQVVGRIGEWDVSKFLR